MATDVLYCRLNARGRKQFKSVKRFSLKEKFPEYVKIGLPAHKGAIEGSVDVLREVFACNQDEGVPSRDVNGATPLHLAVKSNRIEVVKWLLRYTDLSPLASAKHGETPAHVAAAQGNIECLKLLVNAESKSDLKSGLSVATDNNGFTPLHLAIVKQRNDSARVLMAELGLKSVGAVNESGVTAAHVAASAGNVDVLKTILQKYKKIVHQEAADGTTPVYFAAQEGRLEALRFLHTKGKCDLNTPSEDGLKPIHAACQCGHTNIVKYIVSRLGNSAIFDATPDGATPLHFAASAGMVRTAVWLINSDVGGSLVMAKDENGDTPAHDAADNGQTEALKLLLDSGADIYDTNADGNTPYSLAASGQNPEAANFVMAYASKTPQKQDQPSQMTIYDLQGEVDVVDVDFGAPVTGTPAPKKEEQPAAAKGGKTKGEKPGKASSKKDKKKGKKEKDTPEKKSSFLGSSNPTIQSFGKEGAAAASHDQAPTGKESEVLEMTDDDLAMFLEQPKGIGDDPFAKQQLSGDGSDIVVQYSSEIEGHVKSPPVTADYSTMTEIATNEERKVKKRGRQSSKSIQSALKPSQKVSDESAASAPPMAFMGEDLGFKPQFRSNPLQHMAVVETHSPPPPPPTPATGSSISAPSDEALASQQSIDTEEEDEEDDAMPYDEYSKPDVTVKPKPTKHTEVERPEQQAASENQKLLEDVLDDLSDEELPPPALESKSTSESESDEDAEEMRPSPKVSKIWPPPPAVEQQERPAEIRTKREGASVLRKWQVAVAEEEKTEPKPVDKPKPRGLSKKWPPDPTENEEPEVSLKWPPAPKPVKKFQVEPPETKPAAVPPAKTEPEEKLPALAIRLRPTQRQEAPSKQPETETVEIGKIQLKKAANKPRAAFTSPERETTSGAGDELRKLLQLRQKE